MSITTLPILFKLAWEIFKVTLIYIGMGISLFAMTTIPLIAIYKTMKVIRRNKNLG